MMRWIKIAAIAALLQLMLWGSVSAQTQMLLPYNQPIFQATWENPAVVPQHRFSLGLPLISSIEAGVIFNGATLDKITVKRDGKLFVQGDALVDQLNKHKHNLLFSEVSFDFFHFRMMWRNNFFWIAARNVLQESFLFPRELSELAISGNKNLVGKEVNLTKMALDLEDHLEFTFGWSRMVSDKLTFGIRASLLTGLADAHLRPKNINLAISGEEDDMYAHRLDMVGTMYSSGIPRDEKTGDPSFEPFKNPEYFKKLDWVNLKNPGAALAGAISYRPEPRTNLTVAFSDLGFIHWGDKLTAYTVDSRDNVFKGFSDFGKILTNQKVDWGVMKDNMKKELNNPLDTANRKMELGKSYNTWLSPRFHVMATYDLARATTAGVSFSGIFHQGQFYPSATLSLQQGISNLFLAQVAASYNQRSFFNVGASLVFCPGPIQFYIVSDNLLGFIKPSLLNATNIRLGINIVWGPLYPNNHQLTHR